jgi:alkylated DNA repair protein alkB family protein 1
LIGFEGFKPEAGIINYYHLNSTLSGHQDHSEENLNAPLFSVSYGNSALFLIGGTSKDVKPKAIGLRSGDVVVMSGESRLAYV